MINFSNKDPAESPILTFDFSDELTTDDPIASITSVTITVTRGTDPAASSMLFGSPLLINDNLAVDQQVRAGVSGCNYSLKCVVKTVSNRDFVRAGTLRVRNAT